MSVEPPTVWEFAAVRVPFTFGPPREIAVHQGAVGVLARVDGLNVEVHYRFEVGAPLMPLRLGLSDYGTRYSGARHMGSVWAYDRVWHVLLEDPEA